MIQHIIIILLGTLVVFMGYYMVTLRETVGRINKEMEDKYGQESN